MIKKYNKEVGFIYKNENNIDKIYKNNQLVFEQGFDREDSGSTPLTTSHEAIGKDLKGYKIYGNSRQNNLPDGYTEVEWIKSNKDIDLGIKTNNNIQIEAKFLRTTTSTQFVYHSDSGSSLSTNTTAYASGNGIWRFGSKATSIQQSVDVIFETIQNKDGVWFNGEKVGNYTSVSTFTSSTNLCALGSASNPSNQLYYLKVKEYGSNTYDYILIPCKRNLDNVYGLYDVIGNEFYTNSEATITAGNDVVPSPSYPIKIESVGDKTVNVMPSAEKSIKQENGVTIECDGFGTYIITGTASHDTTIYFDLKSSFTIPVSKYKDGEGTMSLFNSDSSLSAYIYFMNNSSTIDYWVLSQINRISNSYSLQGGKECNKIGFKVSEGKTVNMTVSPVFTNDGIYSSEPIPYGYKIPITVSDGTNTTNIYLNEPLRKVGNYADYINYKEQKVYRNVIVNDNSGEQTIENSYSGTTDTTGTSVTLPNIPSLVGTTTYNVDTKVKPSNMYIKYKGK